MDPDDTTREPDPNDVGGRPSDAVGDRALQRELDALVLQSLRPICAGLALVFVVVALVNRTAPPPLSTIVGPYSLVLAVVFGALHLWLRYRPPAPRWAHPLATGIVLLALTNTVLPFTLMEDPLQTTDLLLASLGIGVFFLDKRWFRVTLVFIVAMFGTFVYLEPAYPSWDHMGIAMLGAVVISSVAHDHRYRVQRELLRSNRELEATTTRLRRSVRDLDRYAHVAAHELQEPLRDMSRFLQRIEGRLGDTLDEESRQDMDHVVDGTRRLHARLRDLLTYAELDARPTRVERVDPNPILARLLRERSDALEAGGVEVDVEELPPVLASPETVATVLGHLLDNAITYGGPELTRVQVRGGRRSSHVVVRVEDDGPGIPPGQRERVVEPFHRLHPWSEVEGTGMGLAICARLVERAGGELEVGESALGGGMVSFRLPAADASL